MKLGFDINHPIEIFAAKAEAGELGDNLPPGAPIEYIDLTETHPKYVLEKYDQWEDFKRQCLTLNPIFTWITTINQWKSLERLGSLVQISGWGKIVREFRVSFG